MNETCAPIRFRIIENPEPDYNIEEVIKEYLDTELTTQEIKKKHSLTTGKYSQVLMEVKRRGLPLRSSWHHQSKCKYYYYKGDGYYAVKRVFKGKAYYFGYFKTEEEAKERVKELWDNGWDGFLTP